MSTIQAIAWLLVPLLMEYFIIVKSVFYMSFYLYLAFFAVEKLLPLIFLLQLSYLIIRNRIPVYMHCSVRVSG